MNCAHCYGFPNQVVNDSGPAFGEPAVKKVLVTINETRILQLLGYMVYAEDTNKE